MAVDHAQMLRRIDRSQRRIGHYYFIAGRSWPWDIGTVSPWGDYATVAALAAGLVASLVGGIGLGVGFFFLAFLALNAVVVLLVRLGRAPTWCGVLEAQLAAYKPHVLDVDNWNRNIAPMLSDFYRWQGPQRGERSLDSISIWLQWERWAVASQPPEPPGTKPRRIGDVIPFPGRKEKRP